MKNENEVIGNLFLELEEMDKVETKIEEEVPYSFTVAYGGALTLICCP